MPSPDPVRGLSAEGVHHPEAGPQPDRELALEIFRFLRRRLAPYKRIRRLEFSELPKTVSGKIRRVELRKREQSRAVDAARGQARVLAGGLPGAARLAGELPPARRRAGPEQGPARRRGKKPWRSAGHVSHSSTLRASPRAARRRTTPWPMLA